MQVEYSTCQIVVPKRQNYVKIREISECFSENVLKNIETKKILEQIMTKK